MTEPAPDSRTESLIETSPDEKGSAGVSPPASVPTGGRDGVTVPLPGPRESDESRDLPVPDAGAQVATEGGNRVCRAVHDTRSSAP